MRIDLTRTQLRLVYGLLGTGDLGWLGFNRRDSKALRQVAERCREALKIPAHNTPPCPSTIASLQHPFR